MDENDVDEWVIGINKDLITTVFEERIFFVLPNTSPDVASFYGCTTPTNHTNKSGFRMENYRHRMKNFRREL